MAASRYKRKQGYRSPIGPKVEAKRLVVSYLYLDRTQGQTLEQWDKVPGRLLRWANIVQALNNLTVTQAIQQRIIVRYTKLDADIHNMPKSSNWSFPKIVPSKDIVWCKIVVMQVVRVIGYLEDNVFYVVFLDEHHEFYPTEPKNT